MYWNIGKSVLTEIIGIQDNFKEQNLIYIGDKNNSCTKCPWFQAALCSSSPSKGLEIIKTHCCNCNNGLSIDDFTIETKYVNEKNKYGNRCRVCHNAAVLFILLNRYNDSNGFIKSLSIHELAKRLCVHTRTINNNLKVLSEAGYIYVDRISTDIINIILLDADKYYLSADKGGRGFVKFDDEFFDALLNIKSVLAFRIALRTYIDDTKNERTFKELHRCLPAYCKKGIILGKIQELSDIFSLFVEKSSVKFEIKSQYSTKTKLNKEQKENSDFYSKLLSELDNFVLSSERISEVNIPQNLKQFFVKDGEVVKVPVLFQKNNTSTIISDLSKMACKYSRNIVTQALADTYRICMCKNKKLINNIGAYIHEVIKSYGLIDGEKSDIDFKNIKRNITITAT